VFPSFTVSRLLIAAAVICGSALPASAQIYTWRDASGNLVLSDKRPLDGGDVTSYAVPHGDNLRTTRATPVSRRGYDTYNDLIVEHARRHNVRQSLVRAVIQVESAFNPWAHSPKGAMGLMQLMPSVAREYKVRNAYDPKANIDAGVRKLKSLLEKYGSDSVDLALAAYNAGEGAIQRFGGVPPYRETQNYVSRIMSIVGLK
jgi:soluble lytic murein transglycosylase-like protein